MPVAAVSVGCAVVALSAPLRPNATSTRVIGLPGGGTEKSVENAVLESSVN